MPMTFGHFSQTNLQRGLRWHSGGLEEWSVSDWATAAAGEMGEACNAVKKLRRLEHDLANINEPGRQISTRAEAIAKIGEEIADTVIYLDLLCHRLGLTLGDEVAKKFNTVSQRYDFPERL